MAKAWLRCGAQKEAKDLLLWGGKAGEGAVVGGLCSSGAGAVLALDDSETVGRAKHQHSHRARFRAPQMIN